MATTNLYNSISGLLEISEKLNSKLTSHISSAYVAGLAGNSAATSGLVYGGGDVTIANGQITIASGKVTEGKIGSGAVTSGKIGDGAVTSGKIAAKAVTSGKLADDVNTKIGHGETAYGVVSSADGNWHKHSNLEDLEGITSTKIAAWDAAATANHTHSNKSVLDGITANKITSWDNGALVSAVTLETLATPTDGYAASYQLKVNGTAAGTIDIVKDQFIKSAVFGWSTVSTSAGTGWTTTKSSTAKYPCIKIEVYTNANGVSTDDTKATEIFVPLADVFQEYVGGANVKVDGNVISLSGTLPASLIPTLDTSKLPSIPSSKLTDASTYQTAVTQAADWNTNSGKVVKTSAASTDLGTDTVILGNGTQLVKKSDYSVVSASASFGTNTLATAPAITGYIAAQGFQKSSDMSSYVTAAADLDLDTIVMGAGGRAVAKGTKIVSTSGDIAATSGAAMIPTAAAVSSYVANKTTNMVTGTGLTSNYLVAGNGDGKVKITGIASGNVVTNSTGNASSAECIIVAAGANKTVKATAYKINTTTTSGGITDTANQIPNVQAVKAYTDAQDTAAKNYLLNGNASTADGVTEWSGAATAEGSLAYLNAQISDLLTRVSA